MESIFLLIRAIEIWIKHKYKFESHIERSLCVFLVNVNKTNYGLFYTDQCTLLDLLHNIFLVSTWRLSI